jgi:hypothetical protein
VSSVAFIALTLIYPPVPPNFWKKKFAVVSVPVQFSLKKVMLIVVKPL